MTDHKCRSDDHLHEPTTETGYNSLKPLVLNPDEFRDDLAEFELTREQENELLQTLWNIMSTMVNIGWGVDSVQMLLPDLFEKAGDDYGNLVERKTTTAFNQLAEDGQKRNGGTHD